MNTAICITLIIAIMIVAIALIAEVGSIVKNERTLKMAKSTLEKLAKSGEIDGVSVGKGENVDASRTKDNVWTTYKVGEEKDDEVHH